MNYTNFEVTSEVTAERYSVEFRWMQTAISLRRTDTVDVKFLVNGEGKIIAIPHGPLEAACKENDVRLSDELVKRVAAGHLRWVLTTGIDAEKHLITLTPARVGELVRAEAQQAAQA